MSVLYLLGFIVLFYIIYYHFISLKNKIFPPKTEKHIKPNPKTVLKITQPRIPHDSQIKSSSKNDNMNYDTYVFSAKSTKTHRMHKNRTVIVMEGEQPEDCIVALGYQEPISYEKKDFRAPDYSQRLEYLYLTKNMLPSNASYEDANALIQRSKYDPIVKGRDKYSPHPELVEYATKMKIQFSYYIGKKHLYELIFNSLSTEDKIIFYIYCVYKDIMHKRGILVSRNPKLCEHYESFCEFSKLKLTDTNYVNSLSRIDGHTLRFFGEYNYNGKTLWGASTTAMVYKEAVNFLSEKDCI